MLMRTSLAVTSRVVVFTLALAGLLAPLPAAATPAPRGQAPSAPTFTVNSAFDDPADLADPNDSVCRTATNNDRCTLRAAVMKANRFPGGGVTIIIPSGSYTLTILPVIPNDDQTGSLNITQTTTIVGAGMDSTVVDGGGIDRVFVTTGTVSISNLTVRGAHVTGGAIGGGIVNNGVLTLNNVRLTQNFASYGGGFGNVFATATINNSLIDNNTANSAGGGVENDSGLLTINHSNLISNTALGGSGGALDNRRGGPSLPAAVAALNDTTVSGNQALSAGGINQDGYWVSSRLTLNRSTLSANSASQDGGGLFVHTGTVLTLNNSTFSANSAQFRGGGLINFGTSALYFATLAGNVADSDANGGSGGAIYNGGSLSLWYSVLGENYAASLLQQCAGTPITSHDYNYSQDNCGFAGATGNNLTGGELLLGPLQNNGGATSTRALFAGSPVLDRIPNDPTHCQDSFAVAPTTDQRGVQRPINGLCDMGAFEGSVPLPLFHANLIRNGDAEDGAGSPDGAFIGVPHWTLQQGQFTAVTYGAAGGFPAVGTDIVPAPHGYNFFAGGVAQTSEATQVVTLTAGSAAIDRGLVKFDVSGDFGGYTGQNDAAQLTLTFLDSGHNPLGGPTQIGNFSDSDRGSLTGLLPADARGAVPMGARYAQLDVRMTRVDVSNTYNDGYADNLSLVLQPPTIYLPLARR